MDKVQYYNLCVESDNPNYPAITLSEFLCNLNRTIEIRDWLDSLQLIYMMQKEKRSGIPLDVVVADMSWAITYATIYSFTSFDFI